MQHRWDGVSHQVRTTQPRAAMPSPTPLPSRPASVVSPALAAAGGRSRLMGCPESVRPLPLHARAARPAAGGAPPAAPGAALQVKQPCRRPPSTAALHSRPWAAWMVVHVHVLRGNMATACGACICAAWQQSAAHGYTLQPSNCWSAHPPVPPSRLGIYSSATRPTVTKALHKLQGNLANFLQQRRVAAAAAAPGAAAGGGGKKKKRKKGGAAAGAAAEAGAAAGAAVDADGFPLELPKQLFEVVMARDHCVPASKVGGRLARLWRLPPHCCCIAVAAGHSGAAVALACLRHLFTIACVAMERTPVLAMEAQACSAARRCLICQVENQAQGGRSTSRPQPA